MVWQFLCKRKFLLHRTNLKKTLQILTYVFNWLYFTQCLTSFFSIDHLLLCLYAGFFILFDLTLMRFSRSTHLLCLAYKTLMSIVRLPYSGGTERPGELCYNFSVSNDLTQMVSFPTQITDCHSNSPSLLDYFFPLTLVFVLQWLSLHW